jgi:hypothetical protein
MGLQTLAAPSGGAKDAVHLQQVRIKPSSIQPTAVIGNARVVRVFVYMQGRGRPRNCQAPKLLGL